MIVVPFCNFHSKLLFVFFGDILYTPWGRHGRDRMVVKFTTTCAISAYHH
jgi:hypothetical protein